MSGINLSKDKDYLAHASFIGQRNYSDAAGCLRKVLSRAKLGGNDVEQIGFLIYSIGKMKYWDGNISGAKRHFSQADKESGEAVLIRLMIAKFYLEFTDDTSTGIAWLKKALEAGKNHKSRFDRRWKKEAQTILEKFTTT
jgi:hypothetical protein